METFSIGVGKILILFLLINTYLGFSIDILLQRDGSHICCHHCISTSHVLGIFFNGLMLYSQKSIGRQTLYTGWEYLSNLYATLNWIML